MIHALYDVGLVVGGHSSPRALIAATLERLMMHTQCSSGAYLAKGDEGHRVAVTIGDRALAEKDGAELVLPSEERAEFVAGALDLPSGQEVHLVDVPNGDHFVLLGQSWTSDPFVDALKPVLRSYARVLEMAYSHEEHTAELERAAGDAELRARQFRAALDNSDDAVFLLEPSTWTILDCNEAGPRRYGVSRDELLGGSLERLRHDEAAAPLAEALEKAADGGGTRTARTLHRGADGSAIPVEVRANDAGDAILLVARDISAQVRAEEATQQQQERLERIVARRTSELASARDEAIHANRTKSAFLANVSHELRTPLNSILGFTSLIRDGLAGPITVEQRKQLDIIYRSSRSLLGLINDILDLSRVEAGKLEVRPEWCDATEIIRHTTDLFSREVEGSDLRLELSIPDEPLQMRTDPEKLQQILVNLVGNAVKFTERGWVRVEALTDGAHTKITVADSGPGLPEDASRLFEAFARAPDALLKPGTGLGLAITQRFAHALGGDVRARNTADGALFEVALPAGGPSLAPAPAESDGPAQPLVLVVDDDPAALTLVSTYLRSSGYHTLEARNGREAVVFARAHSPVAITLDILMPEQDGWETLEQLQADPQTRRIPILLTSCLEQERLGLAMGASSYLRKPIERETLLSALRDGLSRGKRTLLVARAPAVEALARVIGEAGLSLEVVPDLERAGEQVLDGPPALVLVDAVTTIETYLAGLAAVREKLPDDVPLVLLVNRTPSGSLQETLDELGVRVISGGAHSAHGILEEVVSVAERIAREDSISAEHH